ncbi:methionine--tRNA ligase [Candidatus Izimaplasma bacterium ZiA1]|uniref:methionine--tRNA ligase n=1 Tax=Candidatus Izimoplasma sp. ZiA1 TaxID=2024899 RepID=UPI000BAA8331|nr:methionine--tRNA ligase [Candidatus Izimaplasma bacterium ZiA1]
MENIFVGGAWPYANGSLHIGHLAGLLPGDVIARYHRLKGDRVIYVSGSDCHGTPIALRAKSENVSAHDVASKNHYEFVECFNRLEFSYDYYSRTDSVQHKEFVKSVIRKLHKNDFIYELTTDETYCTTCNQFLPDRFVEGVCPLCNSNARGDQCDHCGKIFEGNEILNPTCKTCGSTTVLNPTKHLYFKLKSFEEAIRDKVIESNEKWRINAINNTLRYINEGLIDKAITRDLDLGVDVPISGYEDKKIYVWIEAVIGYLSGTSYLLKTKEKFEEFWNEKTTFYYVHGKDNIPFHSIILPAINEGIGYKNLNTRIISSEYLTLEGKKISTSSNWAVWLPDILSKYNADAIRYFLLINNPEKRDADFSYREFINSNNSELLGAWGNLINRTLIFVEKYYNFKVPSGLLDKEIFESINSLYKNTGLHVENGEIKSALENIFLNIRSVNKYFDEKTPWATRTSDPISCDNTIYNCVFSIINIAIILLPFLPKSSTKVLEWLNVDDSSWEVKYPINNKDILKTSILFERIDKERITIEEVNLKKSLKL